ncbi:MAG: aminopeptidase P family protein [Clostridia bacterium]|nr:aminopeptidase P family protein [Clostridia bacterium]
MSHLSNFKESLVAKGFDAAIVSDKLNQRYLSDFPFDDGLVLVTRGESYLITDFRYVEAARVQTTREMTVLTAGNGGMLLTVAGLLSDHGCKVVAVEEKALSHADFLRDTEVLCDYTVKPGASELLSAQRAYKDERELDTIARAQSITDLAFSHIVEHLHPEMTELEVALELEFFMRRNGADGLAFETIAISGSNSSRPHGVPRRQKLEKGFLTLDFGATVDGYCSDMTRTVVLGRADAEMKKLYNTVLTAQQAALDAACEGASLHGLDAIARSIIDGAGYKGCFGHSLGHGVGLLCHEGPRLSPASPKDATLQRGHVVTFEPGIYLEGKYGCRIEDLACVRPDGSFYDFTNSSKELLELF